MPAVDQLPASPASQAVVAAANEHKLPFSFTMLPEDCHSPQQLANHCGCETSQIIRTVLFRGQTSIKPSLMLFPGHKEIDVRKISALIGYVLIRAEEAFVVRRTGFPSAVLPPMGLATPIPVVMDELLLRHTHLWCLAGDARVAISFPSEKLSIALSARIASLI